MKEFFLGILKWLARRGATAAVDGYDRLTKRLEDRLDLQDKRLDDCEKDRNEIRKTADELRYELTLLKIRTEECEEDRKDMRKEISGVKDKIETIQEKTSTQ